MSTHDELMEERRKKRDLLQAAGMNPYEASTTATHTGAALKEQFPTLMAAVRR